jgi:hypothetical protein
MRSLILMFIQRTQNCTEQYRTEQNRTEQNRTGQNRTEQNRTERYVTEIADEKIDIMLTSLELL